MASRILVVDDDLPMREMIALVLSKEGYGVRTAATSAEGAEAIESAVFDLIITDIYLGDGTGLDLLELSRRVQPEARVILVTAHGTVETASSAQRLGVFDYLAKPFPVDELVGRVRAALRGPAITSAGVAVGPKSMIVGNDPAIVRVYTDVARVAPLPIPVLICGETGTGKELIARALHTFGAVSSGPFVVVNCGAIPQALLESELFGHRKGSFTGADRDRLGAVEAARDGTLFLDEIGELPLAMQVKLLRFMQSGEIRPVGGDHARDVPVRVVSATNRDLRSEVKGGSFREDLFYRLAAYEIELPPLRRRISDLPLLVEHFRRTLSERLGFDRIEPAAPEVLGLLQDFSWPGNVRQLEHLVQRLIVDCGSLADVDTVRKLLDADGSSDAEPVGPQIGDELTLKTVEKLHIERVLERSNGNRTHAAEILGIERKSLYRKAQRLGIHLEPKEDEA